MTQTAKPISPSIAKWMESRTPEQIADSRRIFDAYNAKEHRGAKRFLLFGGAAALATTVLVQVLGGNHAQPHITPQDTSHATKTPAATPAQHPEKFSLDLGDNALSCLVSQEPHTVKPDESIWTIVSDQTDAATMPQQWLGTADLNVLRHKVVDRDLIHPGQLLLTLSNCRLVPSVR